MILISDGHSSRLDFKILNFLLSKDIYKTFFSTRYDWSNAMLDQINKNIHHEYRKTRDDMLTSVQIINREAFMIFLGEIWGKWATEESIVNSAKLDVTSAQQD